MGAAPRRSTRLLDVMVHIYPAGVHLALDSVGALLSLGVLALLVVGAVLLVRRVDAALTVALFAGASILGIAIVHRGTMAPDYAWPLILAAYEESTGQERRARAADIRAFWRYGEIREDDWLNLAKRWSVCHGMWYEQHCRRPSGPYEAQGIAREILQHMANGRT